VRSGDAPDMKRPSNNLVFVVSAILVVVSARRFHSNPTESLSKPAKTAQNSFVHPDEKGIVPASPGRSINPSQEQIDAYVRKQAVLYGVDPEEAVFIVSHESEHGKTMRGDDGQSRGYWMISETWHPEVSTSCADDLACSTDWALHYIASGRVNEWTTWKFRCEWYEDAPDCAGN